MAEVWCETCRLWYPMNSAHAWRPVRAEAGLSDDEIMSGLTDIGRCYECGSSAHTGSEHEKADHG